MTQDGGSVKAFTETPFDYLIIGGGTAGLVVAARLSERQDLNIGVLEAGYAIPDDTPAVSVPGRWGEGIGTEYDWQFETTPQKQLDGRKLPWPRGKALGGSAALNFMIWNRPSSDDLDAWERLGCKGWGWNDMLHYYKKSEKFIEPDNKAKLEHTIHYDREAHGTEGPLTVSFNKQHSVPHQYWHETLENLGVATNKTHMSGSNVGAWTSMVAVNPKTATREYSATSYYRPVKDRKNLTVLTGATVQNVVLEQSNGGDWMAKGVRFEHGGSNYVAHASREVILSAGSVKSPQILELSGIGNPSILDKANIETKVVNKNVGENLQDHLLTATIYEIDPSVPTLDDLRTDPKLDAAADEEYKTHLSGPRTLLSCSIAYIPLSTLVPEAGIPALTSHLSKSTDSVSKAIATRLEPSANGGHVEYIFDVGNWNPFTPVKPDKKYATLLQILQYPFSRGSIHAKSADPNEAPVIDPQYYENEGQIDREIQLHAAGFGQKILETEPLKSFVKGRVWPPPGVSKAEWNDWIVGNTTTDWHPVATCAMGGKEGKEGGVVDERLRVYGVKGLRVVDASVMPLQISAHLQATVYAIGEKGADLILEDARE
ncbi:hypothetical protein PRZ48_003470 [Zasmidium cellare]|uniref:Glucose-methanol-choline oxidoreductase N-terminal domain-containing protein n=1 Tax=Zasmidium cellare TaxID=395010 RepID=A0ABR0EVH8_ZASCE|nr:hypothetical protein PRZ48_003470 [Zasmidium cellare]